MGSLMPEWPYQRTRGPDLPHPRDGGQRPRTGRSLECAPRSLGRLDRLSPRYLPYTSCSAPEFVKSSTATFGVAPSGGRRCFHPDSVSATLSVCPELQISCSRKSSSYQMIKEPRWLPRYSRPYLRQCQAPSAATKIGWQKWSAGRARRWPDLRESSGKTRSPRRVRSSRENESRSPGPGGGPGDVCIEPPDFTLVWIDPRPDLTHSAACVTAVYPRASPVPTRLRAAAPVTEPRRV